MKNVFEKLSNTLYRRGRANTLVVSAWLKVLLKKIHLKYYFLKRLVVIIKNTTETGEIMKISE